MNTLDKLYNMTEGDFFRNNHEEILGPQKSNKASSIKASLESRVETYLFQGQENGGRQVFARSIELNFSLNISSTHPEFEYKAPGPSDVAKTVLGFVEQRIESERRNGADEARLASLLNQARAGVEQGFSSAKEDIEALGLMDESLEVEIAESRELVDRGIDNIEVEFIDSAASNDKGSVDVSSETPVSVPASTSSSITESSGLNAFDFFSPSSVEERAIEAASLSSVSKYKYASLESSDFTLMTRDGDKVSISFSDTFASVYQSSDQGFGLAVSGEQSFQFSVEGGLDEGELAAINKLLSQVGDVAELFFENRFHDAFQSALSIGFDSTEIAAFSLDLSKSVVEEVRSYGSVQGASNGSGGDLANAKRYQPIIEMANHLSQLNASMRAFEAPRESMLDLIRGTLERVQEMMGGLADSLAQADYKDGASPEAVLSEAVLSEAKVTVSQVMEFSEYILPAESK